MTTFGLRKDLKPLTNLDLEELVNELKIKNFRGVFMRDTLPTQGSARHSPSEGIKEKEVGIVNLDSSEGKGTHWVCYSKNNKEIYYFFSFELDPPIELQEYLKGATGSKKNLTKWRSQTLIIRPTCF